MITRILVAIDDDLFGEAIEEFLKKLELDSSTTIRIVHVFEPSEAMASWPSTQYRREAESLVGKMSDRLSRRFPDLTMEETYLEGFAADTIIDNAAEWKADMVVVGSHGRRGVRRFLLGSVSGAVVSYAPCSVVVVRQAVMGSENQTSKQAAATSGKQ